LDDVRQRCAIHVDHFDDGSSLSGLQRIVENDAETETSGEPGEETP